MPKYKNKNARAQVIEMAEAGLLDWETVCRECLERMSTDDVKDMVNECDWDEYAVCL